MALEKCNAAISAQLGRELTDREKRIVSARATELSARIQRANTDPQALNNVLMNFADEVKVNAAIRKRATALNYVAYSKVKTWRQSVAFVKDNPAEAFKALMRGSLRNFEGSKNSLTASVYHEATARSGALLSDLEKAGLREYAFSGADDKNINRAWTDLKEGRNPSPAQYGKNAVAVAKLYDDHLEALRQDHNQAGAWIGRAADRTFRRSHDANKIAKAGGNTYGSDASRDAWVKHVNSRLDWSRAFEGEFSNLSDGARVKTLQSMWNDFKDNIHWNIGETQPPVGMGVGSYAKRLSHGRQLIFRSADDELTYFKTFGTGSSVAENVFHNLSGGGRDLALMQRLGPNPRATIDRVISDWKAELDQPENQHKRVAFQSTIDSEMNNTWRLLTEGAGHPADNFVGRFASAVRGITNTAAIGMSIFTLPGDLATRASMVAQMTGKGFGKSLMEAGSNMLGGQGLSVAERNSLFSEIGIRTEAAHLPLDPHLVDHVGFGNIARFNQQVMSVTGHSWWDNRFRLNSLVADGFRHWELRNQKFADLNAGQRGSFQQFGIDEKGWDILRSSQGTELSNGKRVFMPSDVSDMALDKFKPLVDGAEPTESQLIRARNTLASNYRNMLGEMADRSVSAPSIANRAMMGLGYKSFEAGTLPGELYRGALQLKGWAVNYMSNHLGRELYGYDNQMKSFGQAMKDTLTGGNNRALAGLAKLISAGVVIASATNMLRDMADGKEPENPIAPHALLRAFGRQSLGLYSDFLFQDVRPGTSFWDRVGRMTGPEIGLVADIADAGYRLGAQVQSNNGLTDEDMQKDTQSWLDTIYRNTPGTSVAWAKYGLDYFVLDNLSEMLNPGYKDRLQKRMEQQGRAYLPGLGP